LGRAVERLAQVAAVPDEQRAHVVRLEEPLVRVDRHAVRELEARHPPRVARRQARGPAVRGVDMEPQALPCRQRRQLRHQAARARSSGTGWTEPVFGEPATAAMAIGVRPASRSRAIASATGAAWRRNRSSAGTSTSVSGGKPSSSRARAIEKWAWSLAYTPGPWRSGPTGGPARPRPRGT